MADSEEKPVRVKRGDPKITGKIYEMRHAKREDKDEETEN